MAEFTYEKLGNHFFPILPIRLRHNTREIITAGLLDSGALISLFTMDVAEGLGIDVKKGKKESLGGISKQIDIFIHELEFEVFDKKFVCPVAFSKEFAADINIIGRLGFFEHFVITFDDKNGKFGIV